MYTDIILKKTAIITIQKVPGGAGLEELLAFSVPNQTVDFSMVPHPTGKYIYIIMHESHYILRSNYDEETKSW